MISKWFIGVKAKSKGFVTGFNRPYQYDYNKGGDIFVAEVKPSFTKQSALAQSWETEAEAHKKVDAYRQDAQKELDERMKKLANVVAIAPKWQTINLDEKVKFLIDNAISPTYQTTRGWGNNMYSAQVQLKTYAGVRVLKDFSKEELKAIDEMDWKATQKKIEKEVQYYENLLDFINTKLIVREQDIELKFKDSERRKVCWEHRDANNTAGDYCNCCGGAVPDIPQLRIGGGWGKETCRICAICMSKLADEAKVQAGKISDEIMEHYQTDRFIRSMD